MHDEPAEKHHGATPFGGSLRRFLRLGLPAASPNLALVFVLVAFCGHAAIRGLWLQLDAGWSAHEGIYRTRRIAESFKGLPIDELRIALLQRLPESTPVALAANLRADSFILQRLAEGLYPRPVRMQADHVIEFHLGTQNLLAVWPNHGHFLLSGPATQVGASAAVVRPLRLSASWGLFFVHMAGVLGLGAAVLALARRRPLRWSPQPLSPPAWFALAGLAGAAALAVLMSVATWLQVPLPWSAITIAGWSSLLLLAGFRIRREGLVGARLWQGVRACATSASLWLGSAALASFAVLLSRTPISGWDGRSIWFFRAHQLAHAGMFRMSDITNLSDLPTHPAYPLLFPSWLASFSSFLPFDERQASLGIAALLGLQLLALWSLLKARAGEATALWAVLALFLGAFPALQQGYPDMIVTGFLLIAVVALGRREDHAFAMLALLGASLTKREGLVLAMAALAIHVVISPSFAGVRWRRRLASFACLLPALVHAVWYKILGLPEIYAAAGLPAAPEIGRRVRSMAMQFLDLTPAMPAVPLALAGLAALVVIRTQGARRANGYLAGLVAIVALLFTIAVFLTTPFGFQWHMDRAFNRIVAHGCWLAIMAATVHLAEHEPVTA